MIISKKEFLLLLVISFVYYFLNCLTGFSIPCMFHKLTNLYCPGCGITRLFFNLFKLNFKEAFMSNQLVFIYGVLLGLYLLYCLIKKKKMNLSSGTIVVLIIITILFGVLRNINGFEFLLPV